MPAASAGNILALRLARIAALVIGSLLFLYACEFGDGSGSTTWWVEIGVATGLGIIGLGAGWLQITLTHRAEQREYLVASDGRYIRVLISQSGNLVFHGHDLGDSHPEYEWSWTFRPNTFPAIRAALGDEEGDLLELLEETVSELDLHSRHDPGAWLREHGIPARYREKGDHPTQTTRELPVITPGLPPAEPPRSSRSRRSHRNRTATSRRDQSPFHDDPRASRPDETPPSRHNRTARSHREQPPTPHRDRTSVSDRDQTSASNLDQSPPSHRNRTPTSHHDQSPSHRDRTPAAHRDQAPPSRREQTPASHREQTTPTYRDQTPPSRGRPGSRPRGGPRPEEYDTEFPPGHAPSRTGERHR
jgi:hypothetical protein